MNIAIDCRYVGRSGIGRVCEGILDNLDYSANNYYLIGGAEKLKKYPAARIIDDATDPYSVKGLLSFDKSLNKECSALIIPNFLVPFGVKIPVYSVMHDLIFLDEKYAVRGFADFFIKRFLLKRGMKKSRKIACVSGFTLSRCQVHFPKYAHKCYVNYAGLSQNVKEYAVANTAAQKGEYVVFVGNVKENKGLDVLLSAFEKTEGLTLKIIGERGKFLTGADIDEKKYSNARFTGRISDGELFAEVSAAKYLVQPSRYEGFGSPPLEALWLGTQPVISDIEVFREVYGELPVKFFGGAEDLAQKIMSPPDKFDCREKIDEKYSYKKFTDKILGFIQ